MRTREEVPKHATKKQRPLADAGFERLMKEADRVP